MDNREREFEKWWEEEWESDVQFDAATESLFKRIAKEAWDARAAIEGEPRERVYVPRSIPVTDDGLDAPDGAEYTVTFKRVGAAWERIDMRAERVLEAPLRDMTITRRLSAKEQAECPDPCDCVCHKLEAAAPLPTAREARNSAFEEAAKLVIAKAYTQYGNLSVRQVQEVVQEIRAKATNELTTPQPVSEGRLREALVKGKVGWMDSIDFDHELGHALGGNIVSPDKEDCEQTHSCIRDSQESDDIVKCYAKRVIVFDAAELERALESA